MRKPGSYPLDLYRGDSYAWDFAMWLDSGQTQAADLTGVTPEAQIRTAPGGTLLMDLDCTIDPGSNIIAVRVAAADWDGIDAKKGSWDLQLTYPSGDVVTIVAGAVTITTDVTDPSLAAFAATPASSWS